jgi:uncharacterized protein Yka (UPF0111/DUF47 family)
MTEQHFSEALNTCLKNGIWGFDFLTKQKHKFESKADDIHEEIKVLMYGIDPFQKLQLKEMLIHMGEISDQAYRVSK